MIEKRAPRVFGLDFLRTAAIASVVLSHGGLAFTLTTLVNHGLPVLNRVAPWFGLLQHGGVVGVELFFVLSGFLIGRILLRSADKPQSLFLFYCRRWFRTLPLFWLFVVLNVFLEMALRGRHIGLDEMLGHAFFLRNFSHISLSFFPESWSLAVEEWFYLLFPAALWLAVKITRGSRDRIFLACAAIFFVFSVTARTIGALQPGATWVDGQRCVVIYRLDALMTGMIGAWFALRYPQRWQKWATACAWLGAGLFLVAYANIWTFRSSGPGLAADTFFARTYRFNLFSFGFALMLPWASKWVPVRETLVHTAIRKIALWSYALYLINWPFFQIAALPTIRNLQSSWGLEVLFFFIKMSVLIAISAVFYQFYEAPCTRLREKVPFLIGMKKSSVQQPG